LRENVQTSAKNFIFQSMKMMIGMANDSARHLGEDKVLPLVGAHKKQLDRSRNRGALAKKHAAANESRVTVPPLLGARIGSSHRWATEDLIPTICQAATTT
jgi:hypothetical protein